MLGACEVVFEVAVVQMPVGTIRKPARSKIVSGHESGNMDSLSAYLPGISCVCQRCARCWDAPEVWTLPLQRLRVTPGGGERLHRPRQRESWALCQACHPETLGMEWSVKNLSSVMPSPLTLLHAQCGEPPVCGACWCLCVPCWLSGRSASVSGGSNMSATFLFAQVFFLLAVLSPFLQIEKII